MAPFFYLFYYLLFGLNSQSCLERKSEINELIAISNFVPSMPKWCLFSHSWIDLVQVVGIFLAWSLSPNIENSRAMPFQVRQNGWSLEMYHYNNVVRHFWSTLCSKLAIQSVGDKVALIQIINIQGTKVRNTGEMRERNQIRNNNVT